MANSQIEAFKAAMLRVSKENGDMPVFEGDFTVTPLPKDAPYVAPTVTIKEFRVC